jgi:hypothetical protein
MSDVTQTFTDLGGWGSWWLTRLQPFCSLRATGKADEPFQQLAEQTHPKFEVEHLLTRDVMSAKTEIVACDN